MTPETQDLLDRTRAALARLDLLAWPLVGRPAPALWLGRADILGGEALRGDGSVRAYRTPLDWLRAGRDGIVVLNPERPRWGLAGPAVAAQDVGHGLWLRSALALPQPTILVAGDVAGRAA